MYVPHGRPGRYLNIASATMVEDTTADPGVPSCHAWHGDDEIKDRAVLIGEPARQALAFVHGSTAPSDAVAGPESPTLSLFSDDMRIAWRRGVELVARRLRWLKADDNSQADRVAVAAAKTAYLAALDFLSGPEQMVVNANVDAWEVTCRFGAGFLTSVPAGGLASDPRPARPETALAIVG